MLKLSSDIPYQAPVAFTSFEHNHEKYNVFFHKGYGDKVDGEFVPSLSRYFLQIYNENYEGKHPKLCAYIYFYLDFETKETRYIGTYVDPEHRNSGFASLLTSLWTWICMDNNFYEYLTNKKQRKPFLLYLLKLYGFEINDINKYDTSRNTIYICKDPITRDKYLYFKDANQAKNFQRSNIFKEDNYTLLSSLEDRQIAVIDQVLLSIPYKLQDYDKAYTRSRRNLENHGII